MHIPTLYFEEFEGEESMEINQEKSHHLFNVIRARLGSKVRISNGRGLLAEGLLEDKNLVILNKVQEVKRRRNIKFFLSTIDSVRRMRFVVEKLSELGISSISIGPTIRSGKKRYDSHKLKMWTISALEQSGNPFLPVVQQVDKLDYSIYQNCLDINGNKNFVNGEISNLAIGPEGGWDTKELKNFDSKYRLEFEILRSETAAIVAATLLLGA